MMKIKSFILTLLCAVPILSCCGNETRCKLLKGDHVSQMIDETVDFNNYISYPSGSKYQVTYITPSQETLKDNTMFYQLNEVGDYKFTFDFTFTDNGKEKVALTLTMLPLAPQVKEAKYVVQVEKDSTVSFNSLLNRSGVTITPKGYVDIKFKSVKIVSEYISVENYSYQTVEKQIEDKALNYKFDTFGTYNFNVECSNLSGIVYTTISAVVADSQSFGEDIKQSGAIIGSDKTSTVKLLAPSSMSELSYITYDEDYTLEVNQFMTTVVSFKGQNAPQIMFFSNTRDGVIDEGNGFVVSLENAIPYDRLRVFGPNRLKNDVALVERERSFGRDDLKTDTVYQMKTIVTKISASKMAVKAILLKKEKDQYVEVGTFEWASFNYEYSSENQSIVFLGSKLGNIIFDFAKPYLSDKDGNKIGA